MDSDKLTDYYIKVKSYVDDYISKWNVRPSRLKKYLNRNRLSDFLESQSLNDVKLIDRVLDDVLSSYIALENDSILTFENYNFDDDKNDDILSVLFLRMSDSSVDHEKLLADIFDTSLSRIDSIDSTKHLFRVDGLVSDADVMVFDENDIEVIEENVADFVRNKLEKESVSVGISDGVSLDFAVGDFIDFYDLNSHIWSKIDYSFLVQLLGSVFDCEVTEDPNEKYIVCKDPQIM